ncbi:hypothetical protein FMEAI12_4760007 [Parafrankia sp. Ea1.12]|nr:hypothetical protein FMEAI12_4760007 [Parafrankia sp. Ea1.12]
MDFGPPKRNAGQQRIGTRYLFGSTGPVLKAGSEGYAGLREGSLSWLSKSYRFVATGGIRGASEGDVSLGPPEIAKYAVSSAFQPKPLGRRQDLMKVPDSPGEMHETAGRC